MIINTGTLLQAARYMESKRNTSPKRRQEYIFYDEAMKALQEKAEREYDEKPL